MSRIVPRMYAVDYEETPRTPILFVDAPFGVFKRSAFKVIPLRFRHGLVLFLAITTQNELCFTTPKGVFSSYDRKSYKSIPRMYELGNLNPHPQVDGAWRTSLQDG